MAKQDVENGWSDAPAAKKWLCPECNHASPVEDWKEVEPYCEDCGNHDGRECPLCEHWFDHVFTSREIKSGDDIGV